MKKTIKDKPVSDYDEKVMESLGVVLKNRITQYLNEQYAESEYEKIQNQPPEYNMYAMIKLLNRHQELKREFQNYKLLYGKRNSNIKSAEIMFRNYVLNDPFFEKEYREILDDFNGQTSTKLPNIKK